MCLRTWIMCWSEGEKWRRRCGNVCAGMKCLGEWIRMRKIGCSDCSCMYWVTLDAFRLNCYVLFHPFMLNLLFAYLIYLINTNVVPITHPYYTKLLKVIDRCNSPPCKQALDWIEFIFSFRSWPTWRQHSEFCVGSKAFRRWYRPRQKLTKFPAIPEYPQGILWEDETRVNYDEDKSCSPC